jgi:hypothetical protein
LDDVAISARQLPCRDEELGIDYVMSGIDAEL